MTLSEGNKKLIAIGKRSLWNSKIKLKKTNKGKRKMK